MSKFKAYNLVAENPQSTVGAMEVKKQKIYAIVDIYGAYKAKMQRFNLTDTISRDQRRGHKTILAIRLIL